MADEWTPPTYMHKAKTSDTSFLQEKKRITGKDIKKKRKKIEKHKKKQKNIQTKNIKKTLCSPKSNQSESTQSALELIANEYESSESEHDDYKKESPLDCLDTIIEPQTQTPPLSATDDDNDPAYNDTDHEPVIEPVIESQPQPQPQPQTQSSADEDDIINNSTQAIITAKPVVESIIIEPELKAQTAPPPTHVQTLSPRLVQSVESCICVQSVIMSVNACDMDEKQLQSVSVSMATPKTLDETSLLTILKTLDYNKLDKDGNGLISCHFFRYYLRTKILKPIADQHILKIFQNINKDNNSMYITTEQYKNWANKLTLFVLEKILENKLIIHKKYGSSNVRKYYIDQTSLLSFLKTIKIKDLNDDNGFVKIFDFGLYFQRNYDNFKQITDNDMLEKIYFDIDRYHDGRISNEQYNRWVRKLNQTHLDQVLSMKWPPNQNNTSLHRKFLSV